MPKRSAGILMYRQPLAGLELLLVHPGGPLWAKKDRVHPEGRVFRGRRTR